VIDFFQRLFGKPSSSATAKERLRLVLLSDHLSLAPEVVESLKHDLIEVISRYVEVDAEQCDVSFEQREKQIAMLANIPVLAMKARQAPRPPEPPSEPPAPPAPEPPPESIAAAVAEPVGAPAAGPKTPAVKRAPKQAQGSRPRRKRRKATSQPATAT